MQALNPGPPPEEEQVVLLTWRGHANTEMTGSFQLVGPLLGREESGNANGYSSLPSPPPFGLAPRPQEHTVSAQFSKLFRVNSALIVRSLQSFFKVFEKPYI